MNRLNVFHISVPVREMLFSYTKQNHFSQTHYLSYTTFVRGMLISCISHYLHTFIILFTIVRDMLISCINQYIYS